MKTEAAKKMQGTARPDRDRESKVVVVASIPRPPSKTLLRGAKPVYDSIAKFLIQHRAITELDRFAIANAANAWVRLQQANLALKDATMTQVFPNKVKGKSGELTVYESCLKIWQGYENEFGLTPKAREKMRQTFTAKPKAKQSKLATLKARKPT